jgi:hypothetical protein
LIAVRQSNSPGESLCPWAFHFGSGLFALAN